MLGIDRRVTSWLPRRNILTAVLQNCKNSAVKYSIEKPMFINFVDLSKIFCPKL